MKRPQKTFLLAGTFLTAGLGFAGSQGNAVKAEQKQERTVIPAAHSQRLDASKASRILAAASLLEQDMYRLAPARSFTLNRAVTIHDFDGNEFVLAEFLPKGYGIYCIETGTIVESSPLGVSPYQGISDGLYYAPWQGYYQKIPTGFQDILQGEDVSPSQEKVLRGISQEYFRASLKEANQANVSLVKQGAVLPNVSKKAGIAKTDDDDMLHADVEVDFSWYFKLNINQFPENKNDYCGYVAASMLLAYNEIFKSTGYFSEEEAAKYIIPYKADRYSGWSKYGGCPGGVPELKDEFPTDIWGPNIGSSVPSDIDKAVHSFMKGKTKQYENYNYVSIFANAYDPIKDGCPDIIFGNLTDPENGKSSNHAVVAYGYFKDNRFLCHFGWPRRSQVVMSKPDLFHFGGCFAIYNKSSHVHNEYFEETSTGSYYCGCGWRTSL